MMFNNKIIAFKITTGPITQELFLYKKIYYKYDNKEIIYYILVFRHIRNTSYPNGRFDLPGNNILWNMNTLLKKIENLENSLDVKNKFDFDDDEQLNKLFDKIPNDNKNYSKYPLGLYKQYHDKRFILRKHFAEKLIEKGYLYSVAEPDLHEFTALYNSLRDYNIETRKDYTMLNDNLQKIQEINDTELIDVNEKNSKRWK